MSATEFREDLKSVVEKHSMGLSPDDIREAGEALIEEADRREESAL